jgi:hypothetical protein
MWKTFVQPYRPQATIWRKRIACWIPNATKTHSECIILTAFPLQQWLRENASILRYTYIACLVILRYTYIACLVILRYTYIACLVILSLPRHFTSSDCHVQRRTFRPMVTQWSGYDVEKTGAL